VGGVQHGGESSMLLGAASCCVESVRSMSAPGRLITRSLPDICCPLRRGRQVGDGPAPHRPVATRHPPLVPRWQQSTKAEIRDGRSDQGISTYCLHLAFFGLLLLVSSVPGIRSSTHGIRDMGRRIVGPDSRSLESPDRHQLTETPTALSSKSRSPVSATVVHVRNDCIRRRSVVFGF